MSLYSYRIFEIVAEQHNFSNAAKLLNLTPSAISHSIAKLEEEFGIQLFIRNRNGVMLTDNGERLLPHIRAIQRCNELLNQEISQIHGLSSGTVRIGTFNSVTVRWLSQIIKSFRKKYPNIEIEIYEGSYNDILYWIKSNTVDLAFVVNTIAGDMDVIPLHKDMLLCVTPKDFHTINKDYITVPEMEHMNFILQRDGYNAEVLDFFAHQNMKVYSSFNIENDQTIVSMVEAGLGFCIISKMVLFNTNSDVNVYPIFPYDYRTIGLVTSNSQGIAPATKKMRQEILSFVADNNLMNF